MNWLILVSLISLFLVITILYKTRKIHLLEFRIVEELASIKHQVAGLASIRDEITNLYNQLQSYHDLVQLIEPAKPLPILRGWAASPDFLLEICHYSLDSKPQIIVECSSGASTLVLARCCEINGSGYIYSLEHDPHYAEITRQRLKEQGLERWASVLDAPLHAQLDLGGQPWYSLTGLDILPCSCELLVIDGPPWDTAPLARYPALPQLAPLLAPACAIFLDDAQRPDEQQAVKRWMAEYPEFTLEQRPCEKGCAKLIRQHRSEITSDRDNPN